jgi:DNA-directed RNA polymerase I and III subunit RPAC1
VYRQDEGKTCLEMLREDIKFHIVKLNKEEMVFDLVGVDASLANALRRILLSEVRQP